MTQLKHPVVDFLTDQDLDDLFSPSDLQQMTVDAFCDGLEKVAANHYSEADDIYQCKGDLLELFAEHLLKYKGTDGRLSVCDYDPISETNFADYGIDGIGKSTVHGKTVTVQVKYRQNHNNLTWNDGKFGNFAAQSMMLLQPRNEFPTDKSQMLFITTAGDVHYTVDDISSRLVNVITRKGLRLLCDHTKGFWEDFKSSVKESQTQRQPKIKLIPRDHQIGAVKAILDDIRIDDGKGQIILPTGTGKTLIQAQTIIEAAEEFNHRCFLILSPRILLSFQHLVSVSNHLLSCGIDAEYLNVDSGEFDEKLINDERRKMGFDAAKIKSTTCSKEIGRVFAQAKKSDKILIISGTYHSAERIRRATELCGVTVDLQLNDEAHNMVSEEFILCHGIGHASFHFTATERITDSSEGLGMNNARLWGNITYQKLPKEMIDAGEMLPPVLHIVRMPGSTQIEVNDYDSQFAAIAASFCEHKQRLSDISADRTAIGPKLLVTVSGQETLRGMVGDSHGVAACPSLVAFRIQNPNVRIYAISSDLGAFYDKCWHPAGNKTKDELLQDIKNLSDIDEAIILYVDMLTEGIDVPGITAFMPLRNMGESRFIQGIGRATRLFGRDRTRFYNKEISPDDESQYIKPSAEVVVPAIMLDSADSVAQYVRLWRSLYEYYGRQEHIVISTYNGLGENEGLDDLNLTNDSDQPQRRFNDGVDSFIHQIIGRPDKLDIHELWFVSTIRQNCTDELVAKLYDKLQLSQYLDTYHTIAEQHEHNKTNIADCISMMRNSGQSVFTNDIKKKYGTIYTPDFVVQQTVNLAWDHIPESADKLKLTYCDPAVGDGNFLEYLYEKLMLETNIVDPIKRSYHILTKCLWGFEILQPMVKACKIRLLLLHKQTIQENAGNPDELMTLFDSLNIHWGNTICLPEDTKQEWYGERPDQEGGMLPESYRNMKFDVIIGNPPYTHLRNLKNRRYTAYPKQRDMAQVFVRWALDHMTEEGVCGYNTIDTWLDVKTCDGALETRTRLSGKLREIIQDESIRRYSENQTGDGGGEIPTMVLCFDQGTIQQLFVDELVAEYSEQVLITTGFLSKIRASRLNYPFRHVTVSKYTALRGHRTKHKHGTHTRKLGFVYKTYGGSNYWLVSKRGVYEHTYFGNWKLLNTNRSITTVLDTEFESEIKFAEVSKLLGIWLLGYLNTSTAKSLVSSWCRLGASHGGWFAIMAAGTFANMPVPDYDWYLADRPEQTKAFLKWVETNMINKDTFLAGIDEEFEKLIGDTNVCK